MKRTLLLLVFAFFIFQKNVCGQLLFYAEIQDSSFLLTPNNQLHTRKVLKLKIANTDTSKGYFLPAINQNFNWVNVYDTYRDSEFGLEPDENSLKLMQGIFDCPDSIDANTKPLVVNFSIRRSWFFNAMLTNITKPNQNDVLATIHYRCAQSYTTYNDSVGLKLSEAEFRTMFDSLKHINTDISKLISIDNSLWNGLIIAPSASVELIVFIDYIDCFNNNDLSLLLDFKTNNYLPSEITGYVNFNQKVSITIQK